jgi:uncharacterized protein (DUF1778 family)
MAELMRRTSRQQMPGSPREYRVFWRDDVIVLDAQKLGQLRRQLMGQGRRNRQIPRVASTLLDAMWRQVRGERGRERGREAFNDEMLSNAGFVEFVTEWWPPLDAPTVLGWLRDPDFLARVAEGVLSGEDQRLLSKSWSTETTPSIEDVPLLDELRYSLGDVPARTDDDHELDDFLGGDVQELTSAVEREYGSGGRVWTPPTHSIEDDPFAHVLVDEAQDLTPMQWRMVGRRGRTASWTIVGDPAQSSWPNPAEAALARATALEGKELHEFHLSTNYRNSSEIYQYAAAYAQRVGLDADLPTAVRSTGVVPREVEAGADLEAATRAAVVEVAGQVQGTVGIVVPVARRSDVNAWLASWPELADDAPGARAAALEGKELHEFHLSTNYRNSSEIYDYAAAYAQRVGLDADLPTAVRSTGVSPQQVVGTPDLEAATRSAVAEVAGQVAGTVAVVVPAARRSDVNAWLASWPELAADAPGARAAIDSSVTPSGDDRIVVLTGLDTKGLEFDGIVVVRPAEIEAESATGTATLYVVLTRATQLLTVIA